MSQNTKLRRIAWLLLLTNIAVVGIAVFIKHSRAEDPPATGNDLSALEQSTTPSLAASVFPQSDPNSSAPAASDLQPAERAPTQSSPLAGDAVLDEIRKLVRDPESGLEFTPLAVPPPLIDKSSRSDQAVRWQLIRQRIVSVHALSSAARQLCLQADALVAADQVDEAESVMQCVSQLESIIARLASQSPSTGNQAGEIPDQ